MPWKLLTVVIIEVFFSRVARADEPGNGEVVTVDARSVFAPIGFDDNDEAEVVVDGYLPSGCYRLTSPEITVDHAAKRVTVTPKARFFDAPCIEALVPYFFVAKLGPLVEGGYRVEVQGRTIHLLEQLPVRHALGPGPDDLPYAPVDDVKVDRNLATGKLTATVRGRFSSPCIQWQEARVEDNGKTINVLPLLALDSDDDCDLEETPYEKVVELPDGIAAGRHLLHVRSLNGQAVNVLFHKP